MLRFGCRRLVLARVCGRFVGGISDKRNDPFRGLLFVVEIGVELRRGVDQVALVDNGVAPEDGRRLPAALAHRDRLLDAGAARVAGEAATEVVRAGVREPGVRRGTRPGCTEVDKWGTRDDGTPPHTLLECASPNARPGA